MKKILCALIFICLSVTAKADDSTNFYEIKDIAISQQGGDTATMRDFAVNDGQRKAMQTLQEKMLDKGYISGIKNINDSQINEAIEAVEVRDEKIFTKSYRANLNVTFSPKVISKLFNVAYIKPTPRPDKFLLLPILNDADGTKIWRHKWWDVMQKIKNKNIVLPVGDLEDVRSFTKEDYSVRDFRDLVTLQKKYNANAILLATVEIIPTEQTVSLNLEKIKGTDVETYDYEMPTKNAKEDALYAMAANNIVKRVNASNFDASFNPFAEDAPALPTAPKNMDAAQKPENIPVATPEVKTPEVKAEVKPVTPPAEPPAQLDPATAAELGLQPDPAVPLIQSTDVFVIAPDLISWGRIRQKITNTDLIKDIRIKSFTAGKAFITLNHKSDFADVVTAFEAAGLQASKTGRYWQISERKNNE